MSELVITIGDHIRITESTVLQDWIAVTWSFTAAALLQSRGRWIAAVHEKKAVRVILEAAKCTAATTPVPHAVCKVEIWIKSCCLGISQLPAGLTELDLRVFTR